MREGDTQKIWSDRSGRLRKKCHIIHRGWRARCNMEAVGANRIDFWNPVYICSCARRSSNRFTKLFSLLFSCYSGASVKKRSSKRGCPLQEYPHTIEYGRTARSTVFLVPTCVICMSPTRWHLRRHLSAMCKVASSSNSQINFTIVSIAHESYINIY